MNKMIIALTAAGLALGGSAFAQQKAPVAAGPVPIGVFYKSQKPGETLAKDRLLGQQVTGKDGQVIGSIDDLLLDAESKVLGVILGVGGFLGVGEKQVAVRYGALKITEADGKVAISLPSATKEVLTAVGPYERLTAKKTLLQKAGDVAKDAAKAASDAATKAKNAVTGTPTPTPAPAAPAPAAATPAPAPAATAPAAPAPATPPVAPKAPQ